MADEPKGLTPGQQDALAGVIAARELRYTSAVESPRAILTGGQPGSGKSYIVDHLAVTLPPAGGIITIDPDAIRPELPYMRDRIAAGDLDIPNAANVDAGTVAYRLVQIAKAERRNLLIDGTLQNTERAVGLARELADAGYQVELHGMAVYPDLSHARTYTRREAQIAASPTGFGRGVSDEFHDQAVAGFTKTVAAYQVDKLVTTIALYTAGGTKEAECRLSGGQWVPDISMPQVIKVAHERPTPAIKLATVDAWQMAREAMQRRAADPQEQAKVAGFHLAAVERLEPAQRPPAPPTPQQAADRYDKACEAEASAIRQRAAKLATRLQDQLDTKRAAVDAHRGTMPASPRGPAAWLPGIEAAHARKMGAWIDADNRLERAAGRIEKRLDRVAEYAAPASTSPGAAERLAASNVGRREPELARVASAYATAQREQRAAEVMQEREQQRQRQTRSR